MHVLNGTKGDLIEIVTLSLNGSTHTRVFVFMLTNRTAF